MEKKIIVKRIRRRGPESKEERKRLQEIREKVGVEFPPRKTLRRKTPI
jgi:hypothetical protein